MEKEKGMTEGRRWFMFVVMSLTAILYGALAAWKFIP